MRIDQLEIKDILRFRGTTTIDLRGIEPGLIALTGPNGAGKTSLLEVVPGTIYRKVPSRRDGADPAAFARSREAALDIVFTIEGQGTFHARVSIDGQTRASDAVLEQQKADETWLPLNDGKVSTYKRVIAERFPSLELFLTSAFSAQGQSDRLVKMTPGAGQDIFAEFLGLQRYAVMAKTARQAADRLTACRGRLKTAREVLAQDTAAGIAGELERLADQLQCDGGEADIRRIELSQQLETIGARLATVQDKVSAYTAATERIKTLETELATRRAERRAVDDGMTATAATLTTERATITKKRETDVAAAIARCDADIRTATATRDDAVHDAATKIAGNEKIQGMAADIRAAVAAIPGIDARLVTLRQALEQAQTEQQTATKDLRAVERQLADLQPIDERHRRATTDATLLADVPCGGAGPYAGCQFLLNAHAAKTQLQELEATLRPKAALADQVGALARTGTALGERIADLKAEIKDAERRRGEHQIHAEYEVPLTQSTERVQQLKDLQARAQADAETTITKTRADADRTETKVRADADALIADAQRRHDTRDAELRHQAQQLAAAIARLDADLTHARLDLDQSAAGHEQATTLLRQQAAARAEWDEVTAAIARVESGRRELERRRQELATKRARLVDIERRVVLVEADLLEYQTLAAIYSRDGLPAVETDAAGPEVASTTNTILNHTFGPRFTVDIVTQIEKVGGKGLKDEFSIRVMDNEEGGDWRDLSDLSGGEKVIVCEALMNAIAIYVNTRSAMPIRTLWRDETGSALDPENAIRYVEMLRKVRELGGIHHVFFISHNAEAAALADAQIRVSAGKAEILRPPYAEVA